MKPAPKVLVAIDAHPLAIEQARALCAFSRVTADAAKSHGRHGEILAYLAIAGLGIELHFKALMICARAGRVTKGHDLSLLYAEFPEFLKDFMEWQYKQLIPAAGWEIKMTALTFRKEQPPVPGITPAPKYNTFAAAIGTSSKIFEHARYLFERVNPVEWEIFAFAPDALNAVMVTLDRTYTHFIAGDFASKPGPPGPTHAA